MSHASSHLLNCSDDSVKSKNLDLQHLLSMLTETGLTPCGPIFHLECNENHHFACISIVFDRIDSLILTSLTDYLKCRGVVVGGCNIITSNNIGFINV